MRFLNHNQMYKTNHEVNAFPGVWAKNKKENGERHAPTAAPVLAGRW
jgi:hypothetical protein